jgi:hypothetical protein
MSYGLAVARLEISRRMIMKKTLTSALVALSVLAGIATTATAATYPYGNRTSPQQEPSPN